MFIVKIDRAAFEIFIFGIYGVWVICHFRFIKARLINNFAGIHIVDFKCPLTPASENI